MKRPRRCCGRRIPFSALLSLIYTSLVFSPSTEGNPYLTLTWGARCRLSFGGVPSTCMPPCRCLVPSWRTYTHEFSLTFKHLHTCNDISFPLYNFLILVWGDAVVETDECCQAPSPPVKRCQIQQRSHCSAVTPFSTSSLSSWCTTYAHTHYLFDASLQHQHTTYTHLDVFIYLKATQFLFLSLTSSSLSYFFFHIWVASMEVWPLYRFCYVVRALTVASTTPPTFWIRHSAAINATSMPKGVGTTQRLSSKEFILCYMLFSIGSTS